MRKIMQLGMMGLLFLGGITLNSGMAAGYDGWRYRADLTFSGYGRSETLTNFPALVIMNESTIPGFCPSYSYGVFCAPNGADLRFSTADGTTELPYEIEKWDPSGSIMVWVKIPELVGTNTRITVYWGKTDATAPAYTTNGSTWDANYMGVWHMKEASAATLADSTAHANRSASNSLISTTAKVDGGMAGDSLNTWATIHDAASLKWTNITVETWVRLSDLETVTSKIVAKGLSSTNAEFLMWYFYPDHNLYFGVSRTGQFEGERVYAPTLTITSTDVWYHVVGQYDGSAVRLFANGAELGSGTPSTMTPYNGTGDLYIGAGRDLSEWKLSGTVDELRVSNIARSTNYIYAAWLNQASNSAFVAYGAMRDLQPISFGAGWSAKMKIGFAGYDRANAPVTNFPVLVVLSTNLPGFRYSDFRGAQGADLRFVNSNAMLELSYEIEKWDPNGASIVWVKVPELVDSNTFVWALWGNGGVAAPAYTTNGSTWDANYMGVWHMKEASAATLADSTAHANHSASNSLISTAAKIDGGMLGDSLNTWATIHDAASLKWTNITVETWMRLTDLNTVDSKIVAKGLTGGTAEFLMWYYWPDHSLYFGICQDGQGEYPDIKYAPSLPIPAADVWYHVVGRYDGSAVRLYVNGAELGSGTPTAITPYNGTDDLYIGAGRSLAEWKLAGTMDELRVSNVARSTNYVYAAWLNQASNDVFVAFGEITRHLSGTIITIR